MTIEEAIKILDAAPASDEPSRVNPSLTRSQAIDIVRSGVVSAAAKGKTELDHMLSKRVLQVAHNMKNPIMARV